jgi:hypothetical protein
VAGRANVEGRGGGGSGVGNVNILTPVNASSGAYAADRITSGAPTEISAMMWVKFTNVAGGRELIGEFLTTGNHRMWNLNAAATTGYLGMWTSSDGTAGNTTQVYSTTAINNGEWHLIGGRWKAGANNCSLYVDGVNVHVGTGAASMQDKTNQFQVIGRNAPSIDQGLADGSYAGRARVWQRWLSDQEFADAFAGTSVSSTSLLIDVPFDEGIGTAAADESGNGNTLTIVTSTWEQVSAFKPPAITKTLKFDGVNDSAYATGRITSGAPTELSVTLWVRLTDATVTRELVAEYLTTGNHRMWAMQCTSPNGYLTFWTSADGIAVTQNNSTTAINDTAWHKIGARWKAGTDNTSLYVDGVSVHTGTGAASMADKTNQFQVGGINAPTPISGMIDGHVAGQVRVWERWLSDGEFADDFAGVAVSSTGLLIDANLDEGFGTTTADDSGNGNTLTISGATWEPVEAFK